MSTVGAIMTKDVITVTRETSVRELANLFTTHRVGSIPVVDGAGNLVGIVTETDLVGQDKSLHIPTVISLFDWVIYLESGKKFEKELKKVTGQTVGDILTEEVATVSPSDPVSRAADIMTGQRVNAVPVVEGNRLVGIISRIDLIRLMNTEG
jgi:CBS domain-containing protein